MKPLNVKKLLKVNRDEHDSIYGEGNLEARLRERGLALPERPQSLVGPAPPPRMPDDITVLSDQQLGQLHAELCAHADYAAGQLALAQESFERAKERKKMVHDDLFLEKTGTEKEKEAKVTTDRRYVEANAIYLDAQSLYRAIRQIHEQLVRDMAVVSRNVAIRENQIRAGERNGGIQRVRRPL